MPAVDKDREHAKAAARAADPLGALPTISRARAVVGTVMVAQPLPDSVAVLDTARDVCIAAKYGSSGEEISYMSCRNGPGKIVVVSVGNDGVTSSIFEGTIQGGKLEGPGTLTIDRTGAPKPLVEQGTFKDGELEGLGTLNGKEVFFKGGNVVECLTPSFFGAHFSDCKTGLLQHYLAITGTLPPPGSRVVKQMRRALIDEHYRAEHLRALGNCFSLTCDVAGWSDNASADLAGLRVMLKSSAKIAKLL